MTWILSIVKNYEVKQLLFPKIFKKVLIAVHKIKKVMKRNKPAYMGMGILNFSSTLMDYFHYNYKRINFFIKLNYCLETLKKTSLILANIPKIQNFMTPQTKK